METTTITVNGMTCGHCVASVTEELKEVAGVTDVRVPELVKGGASQVLVDSEGALDLEAAKAAVAEAGYTVSA